MAYTKEQLIEGLNEAAQAGNYDAANEITYLLDNMVEPESTVEEKEESMFSGVGEAYDTTVSKLQKMADPERRLAGRSPGIYTPAATLAIGAGDILVETGKALTPDPVKEGAKIALESVRENPYIDNVVKLGVLASETDLVQDAMTVLKEGFTAFQDWKNASEENAYVARELESIGVVGTILSPSSKFPDVDLEDFGRNVSRKGRQQSIAERKEGILDLITPKSGFGEGRTSTSGLLGRKEYDPTPDERETIDVLSKIPELDLNDNTINIFNVLTDDITKKSNQLVTGISKAGNPKLDVDALLSNIRARYSSQLQETGALGIDKKLKQIDELLGSLRKTVGGGSALEVLEARKQLDKKLRKDESDPDSDIASAAKPARQAISEAMHLALQDALSTGGVRAMLGKAMPGVKQTEWVPDVKLLKLLREQHLTFRARAEVDEKRRALAETAIGRSIERLSSMGINLPSSPLSQIATGSLVVSAATSPFFPSLAGAAAGVGAIALAGKGINSAAVKKLAGGLIQGVDKALKTSKITPKQAAQLRADRLVLVSLLQQPTEKEEPVE